MKLLSPKFKLPALPLIKNYFCPSCEIKGNFYTENQFILHVQKEQQVWKQIWTLYTGATTWPQKIICLKMQFIKNDNKA